MKCSGVWDLGSVSGTIFQMFCTYVPIETQPDKYVVGCCLLDRSIA